MNNTTDGILLIPENYEKLIDTLSVWMAMKNPKDIQISEFINGYAVVNDRKVKQNIYITLDGRMNFTDWEIISPFAEDVAKVRKMEDSGKVRIGLLNGRTNHVFYEVPEMLNPKENSVGPFVNGVARVETMDFGLKGQNYINEKGEKVINKNFYKATDFLGDYACALDNRGNFLVINRNFDIVDIRKRIEYSEEYLNAIFTFFNSVPGLYQKDDAEARYENGKIVILNSSLEGVRVVDYFVTQFLERVSRKIGIDFSNGGNHNKLTQLVTKSDQLGLFEVDYDYSIGDFTVTKRTENLSLSRTKKDKDNK